MATIANAQQEFKNETKFVLLNYLGPLINNKNIDHDKSDSEDSDYLDLTDGVSECDKGSIHLPIDDGDEGDDDAGYKIATWERHFKEFSKGSALVPSKAVQIVGEEECDGPMVFKLPTKERHFTEKGSASLASPVEETAGEDECDQGFELATHDLVRDGALGATSQSKSKTISAAPKQVSFAASKTSRKRKIQDSLAEDKKKKSKMMKDMADTAAKEEAIDREELYKQIAERLTVIGDDVLDSNRTEFEDAFGEIFGSRGPILNYDTFNNVVGTLIKNTVPGWCDVAVMMRFTKMMAVGVFESWGRKGIATVTNYAATYIEQNLAPTIIQQGGWDAQTNVELGQIQSDLTDTSHSLQSTTNPSPPATVGTGASSQSGNAAETTSQSAQDSSSVTGQSEGSSGAADQSEVCSGAASQSEDSSGVSSVVANQSDDSSGVAIQSDDNSVVASQSHQPAAKGLNRISDIFEPQGCSDDHPADTSGAGDSTESVTDQALQGACIIHKFSPGSVRQNVQSDREPRDSDDIEPSL